MRVPDCNYQADLKAGKGGLLKATFDFLFCTHLLQQSSTQAEPRRRYPAEEGDTCDLPGQGRKEKE